MKFKTGTHVWWYMVSGAFLWTHNSITEFIDRDGMVHNLCLVIIIHFICSAYDAGGCKAATYVLI